MNKMELQAEYMTHIKKAKSLNSIHNKEISDFYNIFSHYIQALYWRSLLTLYVAGANIVDKNRN